MIVDMKSLQAALLASNTAYIPYAVGSTVYIAFQSGLGVSTNGGSAWTNRTTTDGLGSSAVFGVYASGSTVYAATSGGVGISTDENGLAISSNGGTSFANIATTKVCLITKLEMCLPAATISTPQ